MKDQDTLSKEFVYIILFDPCNSLWGGQNKFFSNPILELSKEV